jgi:hypothetical protein
LKEKKNRLPFGDVANSHRPKPFRATSPERAKLKEKKNSLPFGDVAISRKGYDTPKFSNFIFCNSEKPPIFTISCINNHFLNPKGKNPKFQS